MLAAAVACALGWSTPLAPTRQLACCSRSTRPIAALPETSLHDSSLHGAGAAELVRRLSREELRAACASRSLRVSGTKAELAARLQEYAAKPAAAAASAAASGSAAASSSATQPHDSSAAAPPRRRTLQGGAAAPSSHGLAPLTASGGSREAQAATDAAPVSGGGGGGGVDAGGGAGGGNTGTGADMEVVVLGSGACNPSPTRSASSLALRLLNSYWLFDVGEGTQVQLQRCFVAPGRIDRIFVTHAHGDHCFGLPGLLCLIARGRDRDAPPMDIYGPAGLRAFLRVTLRFSGTKMLPRFVVHELHGIPNLHSSRQPPPPLAAAPDDVRTSDAGEQPGGLNLRPGPDGCWELLTTPFGESGSVTVRAAPVRHTVPTVGYAVEEASKRGRLRPEAVLPLLLRNKKALAEEWGVRDPRSVLKQVAALGAEEELVLPDGALIRGSDAVGGTRRGRKIAVLGDCCDASPCSGIAAGCDLLVHEATDAH